MEQEKNQENCPHCGNDFDEQASEQGDVTSEQVANEDATEEVDDPPDGQEREEGPGPLTKLLLKKAAKSETAQDLIELIWQLRQTTLGRIMVTLAGSVIVGACALAVMWVTVQMPEFGPASVLIKLMLSAADVLMVLGYAVGTVADWWLYIFRDSGLGQYL